MKSAVLIALLMWLCSCEKKHENITVDELLRERNHLIPFYNDKIDSLSDALKACSDSRAADDSKELKVVYEGYIHPSGKYRWEGGYWQEINQRDTILTNADCKRILKEGEEWDKITLNEERKRKARTGVIQKLENFCSKKGCVKKHLETTVYYAGEVVQTYIAYEHDTPEVFINWNDNVVYRVLSVTDSIKRKHRALCDSIYSNLSEGEKAWIRAYTEPHHPDSSWTSRVEKKYGNNISDWRTMFKEARLKKTYVK